jgi:PEGA domain
MRSLLVGTIVFLGVAQARPPEKSHRVRRYVLRDVRLEGNPSDAERKMLQERVFSTVEMIVGEQGDELVHAEDVLGTLGSHPELKTCFDVRCGSELATLMRADKILSIGIERSGVAGKGDWMVRVWHFSPRSLKVAALDLPFSGVDADQLLGELSRSLGPSLVLESGAMCTLKISSRPEGATVYVAGTIVGVTPYQHTILPGRHAISVEKTGFSKGEDELDCPAGSLQNLSFALTAGGGAVVHKEQETAPKKSPALKIAGVVLVVLGAAGVAAGAAELYLDGRGTCNLAAGQTQCPEVYDTKLAGGALVGAGAAAVAAGVITLVVDAVRKPKAPVSADVGLGYVGVRGRF